MLKLSIITINYNNAEGLRRTIESVVTQTSKDFEYIVIDGGSTDGSVNVIMKHADKIKYWVSEQDKGIFNAQNKGIIKASGEYCQFINSGDWLVNNEVIDGMLKEVNSSYKYSIYYGHMLKKLPNGKIFRDKHQGERLSMLTFYRGTINHSSAFIKRSLYEKYGLYDENLKIASDWKFYLIAIGLHNEPVKAVDLDVTCFDMSGISTTNNVLDKAERRKVLEEYLPATVLADYDHHWRNIDEAGRINRYAITRSLFWFIDRCLARFERTRQ